jgi:two-component system response regulator AtoC
MKKEGNILIVDDQPMVLKTIREILEREGYKTTAVESGEAALKAAREEQFDVLLTDIKMPQMSGLELVEKMSEINPKTIPIMINGYPSVESVNHAFNKGAYNYLLKPIRRDKLCTAVAEALEERGKS